MHCPGTICCRFPKGSDNLRYLGLYLQRHQLHSFQPYFRVQEAKHAERVQIIPISRDVIRLVTDISYFDIGSIVIPVSERGSLVSISLHLTDDKEKHRLAWGFQISGFPRSLAEVEPLRRTPSQFAPYALQRFAYEPAAASPISNEPDRETMAQKFESLRRKRSVRPRMHKTRLSNGSGSSGSDQVEYPEDPSEVGNWVQRRFEARRAAPKPVKRFESAAVFELDGSPVEPALDDDDAELAEALRRSEQEIMLDEEMQRVIAMSLVDQ